jgi:biopolymer transport protein ExbB
MTKEILDIVILSVVGILGFIVLWFSIERVLFYKKVDIRDYHSRNSLEIDITYRLTTIYTIGANVVYIGLLGTVFGIMITFAQISKNSLDASTIMNSLSSALFATALALVVAIPSMTIYNYLLRKVEIILMKWDDLGKIKN